MSGPKRLADAVALVAHLGGYRNRKHDPDPGNQIMWTAYNRLSSAVLGHGLGYESGFEDGRRGTGRASE